MDYSTSEFEKIASLAYIKLDQNNLKQLTDDVASIMQFIKQLNAIDTDGVAPLLHPLDIHQRLREDEVTEPNRVTELANIAPAFEEDHYLVPKVIDTGK